MWAVCPRGTSKCEKYFAELFRLVKYFCDIFTIDHAAVRDAGLNYAMNGEVTALIVKDVATGFTGEFQRRESIRTPSSKLLKASQETAW